MQEDRLYGNEFERTYNAGFLASYEKYLVFGQARVNFRILNNLAVDSIIIYIYIFFFSFMFRRFARENIRK